MGEKQGGTIGKRAIVFGSNAEHQEGPIPERPFSRPNSPSVRIVLRVVRLNRMSIPVENPIPESTIEVAERQRRWLRRALWAGVTFIIASILFAIGYPLFVRWQLQQHGWTLMKFFGAPPSWVPEWAEPWVLQYNAGALAESPVRVEDIETFRRYPNVKFLSFASTDVPDSALQAMSQLSQLDSLQFNLVRLEGNGVRHLAVLPNLRELSFFQLDLDEAALDGLGDCNQITRLKLGKVKLRDEDLRHLSRITGIEWLEIDQCDVTDRGLEHIAQIKHLKALDLRATLITDDGLRSLTHLSQLKSLTLQMGKITDAGAKQIAASCPGLKYLCLVKEPITDATLIELARLPHLEKLDLGSVPITDDGIRHLKSSTSLKTLNLNNTKIGGSGVEDLRKTHPTLEVSIR